MLDRVYVITLSLLVTHQIDAAYWREWEMFRIPGGIQLFDLFNLAIIPLLVFGYKSVILKKKSGYLYSCLLSSLGLLTLFIHTGFYLNGFQQFTLPVSTGIILLCGVSGATQLALSVRQREVFEHA